MSADDGVRVLAEKFASEGAAEYLGEPVTQAAHMLQAAMLAERDHAGNALIAAALLHDVGHFAGTMTGHELMEGTDNRHSEAGARVAGPVVRPGGHRAGPAARRGEAVPVRDRAGLYGRAVARLGLHAGRAGRADAGPELAEFEAHPYASAAIRVRRWDDAGQGARGQPPAFGHFEPVLRALAR